MMCDTLKNHDILRWPSFIILVSLDHRVCFSIICEAICQLQSRSGRKKKKNVVSLTHEQNIICSLTQLDAIAHEQAIIWRQSFTGNVLDSRPIKRKKNLHRMIIRFMQNLARELSVGVTDCIAMGDWKTKNWELQNFHGLKKNDVFQPKCKRIN